MEAEVERVRIETSVTNTKNASLVLALNENDIILSYYKSERHGMVEQLLEMRYYRLAKKPRAKYLKKKVLFRDRICSAKNVKRTNLTG